MAMKPQSSNSGVRQSTITVGGQAATKTAGRGTSWLPNILSASRIISTPIIMALLLWEWPGSYIIAAILFVVAQVTDVLDGYYARKVKSVSNLGIFLDLTADKLLVAGVLVVLVELGFLNSWFVVAILGREFLVSGIRSYASAEGVVIPAGKWGKRKTVWTAIALTWFILYADMMRSTPLISGQSWDPFKTPDPFGANLHPLGAFLWLAWPLMLWVLFLTIFSGAIYVRNAWPLIFVQTPKTSA